MDLYRSYAHGSDLLLLSLKMRCLSESSKTPAKSFFRFIALFYEHGCMKEKEESKDVVVSMQCADKVFEIFTDDPASIEKCLYASFATPGDISSKNLLLSRDLEQINTEFRDERFRNPSLFIDGQPYHEPLYPDSHFSEDQMISDVCAALL